MATHTVDQVADTLINLARDKKIDITNLKLQKLLYYAQAWNLVIAEEPLFDDEIEAWVHGPVVPRVFRRFKLYRWNTIDCDVNPTSDSTLHSHLSAVLDVYGKFGATQLERITHNEDPWKIARNGLPPDASSNAVINHDSMIEYYTSVSNEKK